MNKHLFELFIIIVACIGSIFAISTRVGQSPVGYPPEGFRHINDKDKISALVRDLDLLGNLPIERVSNLIHADREEASIFIFNHKYQTGGGKDRRNHCQTVILLESDTLALPRFSLIAKNLIHKIGFFFGYYDEIGFLNYPQFSQQYLLRGDFKNEIRQLFNYQVISLYESRYPVTTEGINNLLAYYYANRCQGLKNREAFLQEALDVYRLFKSDS